jgi:hypothetical protein
MKRLGSPHDQTPVRPLTMLVEIGCSTGRSLVAHQRKTQRLLQMTDSSNACNRRTVPDAACHSFDASLHRQVPPEQDGFNGDQQFYLAFAQQWASNTDDSDLRDEVLTDAHSPNHWRTLTARNEHPGTLRSQLNWAINSISSQPNGSEFGREMLEDTPHSAR